MKKLVLGLVAVISLGLAAQSFAATDAYLNVRIIVVANDISILRTTADNVLSLNVPLTTQYIVSGTAGVFENDSTTMMEDFSIRANANFTNGTDTWTLVGGVPGTAMTVDNEVRMAAIFAADWVTPIAAGDFLADDVVTLADIECTTDLYARAGDTDSVKGFDVPVSGARNLYLSIDTPTGTSAGLGTEMVSPIIVTASNGWL